MSSRHCRRRRLNFDLLRAGAKVAIRIADERNVCSNSILSKSEGEQVQTSKNRTIGDEAMHCTASNGKLCRRRRLVKLIKVAASRGDGAFKFKADKTKRQTNNTNVSVGDESAGTNGASSRRKRDQLTLAKNGDACLTTKGLKNDKSQTSRMYFGGIDRRNALIRFVQQAVQTTK